jgi:hypothetical protein
MKNDLLSREALEIERDVFNSLFVKSATRQDLLNKIEIEKEKRLYLSAVATVRIYRAKEVKK